MKLLVAFSLVAAIASVAAADPLQVDVLPAQTTWTPGKTVDVTLRVTNASTTPQKFLVFSCSWEDSWTSSDPDLRWEPWACDKNVPQTIALAPKAVRSWTLPMFAKTDAKAGPHPLVMTFTPDGAKQTASAPVKITVGAPPPLIVEVTPAKTTWSMGELVDVGVRIVNTTKTKQAIAVFSCSWPDQWATNDASLSWPAVTCTRNVKRTLAIAPGGKREWTLQMSYASDAKPGAHTVAVTFTPDGGAPITSAPLHLTVTPPLAQVLKLEVVPATTKWKTGAPVDVTANVTNTGSTPVTFLQMSCSWQEHWRSSDPSLTWNAPSCRANVQETITLAAGKSYSRVLPMFASAGAAVGDHALTLSLLDDKGSVIATSAKVTVAVSK
ncbi:MAG TPA: hypothetical protein VGM90_20645 [Kofleriaceae bacterium]